MRNLIVPVIIVISFFLVSLIPLNISEINDGPYIFIENGIVARWIENGNLNQSEVDQRTFNKLKKKFNLNFGYKDLVSTYPDNPDHRHKVRKVDSICAVSDIHGEFDRYTALLKAQGILDDNLNWNFGKGHLVLLGDYFDRGDKVTETLWHLFGLEKQAVKAGGRVHLLLGNHELMIFGEDKRYINEKYKTVEEITGISYPGLFSEATVLGKWLRHKPVIISVNDIIFVHGGLSTETVRKKLEIEEINKLFHQMLVTRQVESERDIINLTFLTEESGPVWYRGFFDDKDFSESSVDSVLSFYRKKNIVVGHTTSEEFQFLFNGKIIGIDAGMGMDGDGAALIMSDGKFFKGTPSGERLRLY